MRMWFDDLAVDVYTDSTSIHFPNGKTIPGAPEDTDSYRQTAKRHGYGCDTVALCQEHELMHVALSHWLGVTSPTLRLLCEDHTPDPADTAGYQQLQKLSKLEEAAVLAIQHFTRAAGIDLVKHFARTHADG